MDRYRVPVAGRLQRFFEAYPEFVSDEHRDGRLANTVFIHEQLAASGINCVARMVGTKGGAFRYAQKVVLEEMGVNLIVAPQQVDSSGVSICSSIKGWPQGHYDQFKAMISLVDAAGEADLHRLDIAGLEVFSGPLTGGKTVVNLTFHGAEWTKTYG